MEIITGYKFRWALCSAVFDDIIEKFVRILYTVFEEWGMNDDLYRIV